ncbi:hypothetical protein [Thalassotalea eurytherma]|uniref:Long-chain fatty acid transporter n=1 Tax=Thalassotalea eurytherma TaxID=1144278 RepID=A0ABQ6H0G1_9GAMM|nr:hypothetical protein [Thalassotalea eurytherma]GLX81374.1 hypothetical protein theurythT_08260 [Thalassotalea eurytherma]
MIQRPSNYRLRFKFGSLLVSSLMLSGYHCALLADEYHYNNLLVGGEAVSLGGAYTALSNDLSVMQYNVAGLGWVKRDKTASINTLSWEQTDFEQVFSNGEDFNRDAFSVIPGFFGLSIKEGKWSYGVSIAATDFSKERSNQDVFYQRPSTDSSISQTVNEYVNINIDNSAYKFTLGTAYSPHAALSYGASLSIEYREFQTVQGSGSQIQTQIGDQVLLNGFDASRRFDDVLWILQPSIAMQYRQQGWQFGVQLSKDFTLSREYEVTSNILVASEVPLPDFVTPVSRISASHDEAQDYPWRLATGVSYQLDKLLLSFDWHFYSNVDNDEYYVDDIQTPITRDLTQVSNFSLGLKYPISNTSSLAFGLFTDNSNAKIDTDIDFQRVEDIDLLGVSFSLESVLLDMPFTVGAYYKWGDGQVRFADIRSVEEIVGLPLYPDNDTFDVADATKRSFILYLSLDF